MPLSRHVLHDILPLHVDQDECAGSVGGLGTGKKHQTGKYFYFVRKPDPREEFIRKGYFLENEKFFYITRKSKENETLSENTTV